jgi:hypothetical protein
MLALAVLAIVVLAGGAFLFNQVFLQPLQARDGDISAVRQDLLKKQERVRQILADRSKLQRWRELSLPADTDLARREYEKYLSELMRESGFAPGSYPITSLQPDSKSSPVISGKGPIYTKLNFTVQSRGDLSSLVELLTSFYRTGLLHQIKNLTIQRPLTGAAQQGGDLEINLKIEALILAGAENRKQLLPLDRRLLSATVDVLAAPGRGPGGVALALYLASAAGPMGPGSLAQPPREYAAIAHKNIFYGALFAQRPADEVEVTQYVHLTDITRNDQRTEANFYDRYNNRKTRLRAETAFDSFRILDNEGETLVRGKVVRIIEPRDLIFRVDDSYYSIHVGQSLEEAMKTPLSADELKALGLVAAPDKVGTELHPAQADK